jgi:oligopeptide transport system permease protein
MLAPFVLWALITISFFLTRLAPGDPFSTEKELPPQTIEALQQHYHLDKPLFTQYLYYLKGVAVGDFGPSFKYSDRSVSDIIKDTLPKSILLGALSLILAILIGSIAGIIAALQPGSGTDFMAMTIAVLGISMPTFVTGAILQLLFATKLQWLPVAGYEGITHPTYLILPAITLALPFTARIARLMRSGMIETLQSDFIKTAKAKGLPWRIILFRHAIPMASISVIAYLGPAAAAIMTGSLVIEKIFQVPGLGREFVESALNRDYSLVMGTVIVYGAFLILFNLIADFTQLLIDPRLREK